MPRKMIVSNRSAWNQPNPCAGLRGLDRKALVRPYLSRELAFASGVSTMREHLHRLTEAQAKRWPPRHLTAIRLLAASTSVAKDGIQC